MSEKATQNMNFSIDDLEKELAIKKAIDEIISSTKEAKNECSTGRKITSFRMKSFQMRPVTQSDIDDWCVELKNPVKRDAPNGYIVRVPEYFDNMKLIIDGAIKKSTFFSTTLYIQVDPHIRGDGYIVDCKGEQPEVHRSGKTEKQI